MIAWGRLSARSAALGFCRAVLSRQTCGQRTHMTAAAVETMAQSLPGPRPQVIILTGPTAVGKTAASLELAHAVDGEIISADSVQVYRGLDIGSAKVGLASSSSACRKTVDTKRPAGFRHE